MRRRFQQRQRLQLVRSRKVRIRSLRSQSIRHLGSSAERMSANDCEHTSMSIGRQSANRSIGEFLADRFPSDPE